MSVRASSVPQRARVLLRREGVTGLARGVVRFLRARSRRIVSRGDYYIYRYPIPLIDPEVYRPRLENLEVVVLETLAALDGLVSAGYEDPREQVPLAEKRLSAGAVAVCGYVGRTLAYMGWVATAWRAKMSFDRAPYHVAFDAGEGVTGGAWTAPEFRGVGLYRYMFGHGLALLRRKGSIVCRDAIAVRNYASQRGQVVYGAQVCARARSIRVLGWGRWTETPMCGHCPSLAPSKGGNR